VYTCEREREREGGGEREKKWYENKMEVSREEGGVWPPGR